MDTVVKGQLQAIIERVAGLNQLVITDRDGVPVIHVGQLDNVRPQLLTTYPAAIEQTSKFAYGQQRSMVAFYDRYQMVFLNCPPFCVIMIAGADVNTGAMLNLRKDLEPVLGELSAILRDMLPKDG